MAVDLLPSPPGMEAESGAGRSRRAGSGRREPVRVRRPGAEPADVRPDRRGGGREAAAGPEPADLDPQGTRRGRGGDFPNSLDDLVESSTVELVEALSALFTGYGGYDDEETDGGVRGPAGRGALGTFEGCPGAGTAVSGRRAPGASVPGLLQAPLRQEPGGCREWNGGGGSGTGQARRPRRRDELGAGWLEAAPQGIRAGSYCRRPSRGWRLERRGRVPSRAPARSGTPVLPMSPWIST